MIVVKFYMNFENHILDIVSDKTGILEWMCIKVL